MKKSLFIAFSGLVILSGISGNSNAQTISCSDLVTSGVSSGTTNGGLLLNVTLNADSMTFINYPYIQSILDCNGDTIGSGSMFFFGQMGQTTQDYPFTITNTTACQPFRAVFVYGTTSGGNNTEDTCFFELPALEFFSCSEFTVTEVTPDSVNPGFQQVSIYFAGAQNSFINYPYISAVLNCVGDTIGTGNLNTFGQFGQSTVPYPVTVTGPWDCEPLTFVFTFSNNSGTQFNCSFTYETAGLSNVSTKKASFTVYPNPAYDRIQISSSTDLKQEIYTIRDYSGRLIQESRIQNDNPVLSLESLSAGLYILSIGKGNVQSVKVIKK
jgi:hypothetical protein